MLTPQLPGGDCTPTTSFLVHVSSTFHTCVPTPLALLSTTLGCFSILSWLFAQLPQIFKNYTLQSASGLSVYFLAIWFLGDTTNLLGAIFTGQASWQVVIALYYVTFDVVLFSQYVWYTFIYAWRTRKIHGDHGDRPVDGDDDSIEVLIGVPPVGGPDTPESENIQDAEVRKHATGIKPAGDARKSRGNSAHAVHSYSLMEKLPPKRTITRIQKSPLGPVASPQTVLLVSLLCAVLVNASPMKPTSSYIISESQSGSSIKFAGQVLSWISTLLYLGSRFPQIYKNYMRQSTSGLSPTLFISAFFGNLFYSTSILTNPLAWSSYPPYGDHGWAGPEGSDRVTWVSLAAPFWLGAAGVLTLDAMIGIQFLRYGEGLEEKVVVTINSGGRRGKLRNVRGWMKGMLRSPASRRQAEEDSNGDLRPLLRRETGDDGRYGSA